MKQPHNRLLFALTLWTVNATAQELPVQDCTPAKKHTAKGIAADSLQALLQQMVVKGAPGVAVAVYSPGGWYTTAAGYAKTETKTAMQPCHLQYLQSISKTYMAVALMRLVEQGRVNLDAPITAYLPDTVSRLLPYASGITVRTLLNHTSGIPEYNSQDAYVNKLLSQPGYPFTPWEYLGYAAGKPQEFAPGSRYAYRNTNYVLLALLADAVTNNHAEFLREEIFKPLKLKETFYRECRDYLNLPLLVNGYWDQAANGKPINASGLQKANVQALVGDDGVVATPTDAVLFLKGLVEGKLVKKATLDSMKVWAKDKGGKPRYGLGLDCTVLGGQKAFGHSGGGIGAGCQLYYFPEKKTYVFIGMNLGTVTPSPLHAELLPVVEKLYRAILK